MDSAFGIVYVKTHYQTQSHLDCLLCYCPEVFFQKFVEISCLLKASPKFLISLVYLNVVSKKTGDEHFFFMSAIIFLSHFWYENIIILVLFIFIPTWHYYG